MIVWMYDCIIVLYDCIIVLYDCMIVWLYDCMSVWVYECMIVWLYDWKQRIPSYDDVRIYYNTILFWLHEHGN